MDVTLKKEMDLDETDIVDKDLVVSIGKLRIINSNIGGDSTYL